MADLPTDVDAALTAKGLSDTQVARLLGNYRTILATPVPVPSPTPSPTPAPVPSPTPAPAGNWCQKKNPKDIVYPFVPHTTSVVNGDLNIVDASHPYSGVAVTGNIISHVAGVKVDNFICRGLWNQSSGLQASIGKCQGSGLDAGFQYSEAILTGVEITGSFDGAKAFSGTHLIDCWIHGLNAGGGYDPSPSSGGSGNSAGGYTHNDGVQISAGSGISLLRTRIEDTGYNSGLFIDPDQGQISGVQILDSFLQGGNFAYFVVHSTANTNVPFNLEVGRTMFGFPAIPAPSWADCSKVENTVTTDGRHLPGIVVNWHDNVDEDGNPLTMNAVTPFAKRWRKHVYSSI